MTNDKMTNDKLEKLVRGVGTPVVLSSHSLPLTVKRCFDLQVLAIAEHWKEGQKENEQKISKFTI